MEEIAKQVTLTVSHAVEMLSAAIIGIAVIKALFSTVKNLNQRLKQNSYEQTRVQFGSSVAVALELMLGADVLETAVAPNWNDIGKLASIAVIRTALNYFLGKELKEIRQSEIK